MAAYVEAFLPLTVNPSHISPGGTIHPAGQGSMIDFSVAPLSVSSQPADTTYFFVDSEYGFPPHSLSLCFQYQSPSLSWFAGTELYESPAFTGLMKCVGCSVTYSMEPVVALTFSVLNSSVVCVFPFVVMGMALYSLS